MRRLRDDPVELPWGGGDFSEGAIFNVLPEDDARCERMILQHTSMSAPHAADSRMQIHEEGQGRKDAPRIGDSVGRTDPAAVASGDPVHQREQYCCSGFCEGCDAVSVPHATVKTRNLTGVCHSSQKSYIAESNLGTRAIICRLSLRTK
jgi:hypothetical protein